MSRLDDAWSATFLDQIRGAVAAANLPIERVPGWIVSADTIAGTVGESTVILFQDSPTSNDRFTHNGSLIGDAELLFPNLAEGYETLGLKVPGDNPSVAIMLVGHGEGRSVLSSPPTFGYFDIPQRPHNTTGFIQMGLQMQSPTNRDEVWAFRVVPLLVVIHQSAVNAELVPPYLLESIVSVFRAYATSEDGRRQADRRARIDMFSLTKAQGVVVLGADTGDHLIELEMVRDRLRAMAYAAELIKRLPDIAMMSNAQKVQMWSAASRFAVMVDRSASGHILEYNLLKTQQTILALLRPRGSGSTYMIGDDGVDCNFIRVFEFNVSPQEVLGDVTQWAESVAQARESHFDALYPWRRNS